METKQEEKEIERRKESERKIDLKVNKEKREETIKDLKVNKEKGDEAKGKESFYAKKTMRSILLFILKRLFVLLYKETILNVNDLDSSSPSILSSLL